MGGAFIGRSAAPAVPTVASATAAVVATRSLFMGTPLQRTIIAPVITDSALQYRDLSATLRENRPNRAGSTAALTARPQWCKLPAVTGKWARKRPNGRSARWQLRRISMRRWQATWDDPTKRAESGCSGEAGTAANGSMRWPISRRRSEED